MNIASILLEIEISPQCMKLRRILFKQHRLILDDVSDDNDNAEATTEVVTIWRSLINTLRSEGVAFQMLR